MSIYLERDDETGRAVLTWWRGLEDDRASRGILRRASSVTAVTLSAPYQRLYQNLVKKGWPSNAKSGLNDRLAAAVGLLVHVEKDDSDPVARCMSPKGEGGQPYVSALRFRRLLESPDLDALYAGLRRVLPLMKHQVNVLALAHDVIHWGDDVRKRWAYDYSWPE